MASSVGTRGKYAEGKVHTYFKKIDETTLNWDFERIGDARSAGGRGAKTVVGDFSFFSPRLFGVVEVKEIKHDFRIPAANISQLPKLSKRRLAGGHTYIVVYHTTSKFWRCIPAGRLELRSSGSWDLSAYPTYPTLEEALPRQLLGG